MKTTIYVSQLGAVETVPVTVKTKTGKIMMNTRLATYRNGLGLML